MASFADAETEESVDSVPSANLLASSNSFAMADSMAAYARPSLPSSWCWLPMLDPPYLAAGAGWLC